MRLSTPLFFLISYLFIGMSAFAARPNVLVILTDDQGWGDLRFHGNQQLDTPRLDRLARESTRLNHFYVQPVCSPTRAEFLTGRYHPRSNIHGTSAGSERMDLDEQTIAEVFREAGYQTAAVGKWHNGQQWPYHPNARGFDTFYGFSHGHWGHYFDYILEDNNEIIHTTGGTYITDRFTDKAIAVMEDNAEAGDRPFFLYLTYCTPHSPMQVPDAYWDRHKDRELTQRGTQAERENEVHTRAALAMVENIDDNVGRLMDTLDTLGIAEETIVVFFTDNGPNGDRWNGGMRGRKGSTDEGGVRSPLFLRWPGSLPVNHEVNAISGAIDLLPTLASLAGLQPDYKHPLDGRNLGPILLEEEDCQPQRFIFSFWRDRLSVRSQNYRLDHEGRLYDMVNDPGQTREMTHARPDLARRMKAAAAAFRKEVVPPDYPEVRPFIVGHPGHPLSYLPARDARFSGGIQRSARAPNDSYLLNWTDPADEIFWDVEVVEGGRYAAILYYAVPQPYAGATVELRMGGRAVRATLTEGHYPPLLGMEEDRFQRRGESYVKLFKPMELGELELDSGTGRLTLSATDVPGPEVAEFKRLVLKRLE
jgi:arylsulfatase A-like enzyme